MKLPNFLSVESRPFDPETYEDELGNLFFPSDALIGTTFDSVYVRLCGPGCVDLVDSYSVG